MTRGTNAAVINSLHDDPASQDVAFLESSLSASNSSSTGSPPKTRRRRPDSDPTARLYINPTIHCAYTLDDDRWDDPMTPLAGAASPA
jgi:hypothetical protein